MRGARATNCAKDTKNEGSEKEGAVDGTDWTDGITARSTKSERTGNGGKGDGTGWPQKAQKSQKNRGKGGTGEEQITAGNAKNVKGKE